MRIIQNASGFLILSLLAASIAAEPPSPPTSQPATSRPSSDDAALLIAYRPRLAEKVRAIPPATIDNLPALLDALVTWQRRAQLAPPPPPAVIDATGQRHMNPMDQQMMASLVGDRVAFILDHNPPAPIAAKLEATNRAETHISYQRYPIEQANVAGTGPVYYVNETSRVTLALPKRDRGR